MPSTNGTGVLDTLIETIGNGRLRVRLMEGESILKLGVSHLRQRPDAGCA